MVTTPAVTADEFGLTGARVLVTGGAGFVGSHLVEALVADNAVTVLDDLSVGKRSNVHPQARFVAGDVRDRTTVEKAMDGADVVFHQAGLVSVAASVEDPVTSHAANAAGTVCVLDCARAADARVVAASSAAVYGQPESVPVPESARLAPTSPYGVDKLALDAYTRLFADLYGLPTVTLRYFNVYGPRQTASYSGVISTFFEQAAAGVPLTVQGDGSQTRDFVHVSDIVAANLLAAATEYTGEAFNVGTGTETRIDELARLIIERTGSNADVRYVERRPGDVRRSCAAIEKATTLLGYDPAVELSDGLESLVPAEHP